MGLETIELSEQAILVHLHAISSRSPCPQCGTPGSRIHSRYQRTIADVAFGARHLILKLVVRKWICREASCFQRIFAERFPGLVQRYARMTDRLVEALQSVGVTTNGADAARILSSLGMPTSAKTVIRHVLHLPLPDEGSVQEVGIDEWAWKKGHQYGTILVNLAERRIVQLLADRSVESSKAWFRTHPEIRIVSRDRGKLFREAARMGLHKHSRPWIASTCKRTLPKRWSSSCVTKRVCLKQGHEVSQEKHALLPGEPCQRSGNRSVVLDIATGWLSMNGCGSSIERDITKSTLPNAPGSVARVSIASSNRKHLRLLDDDLAPLRSLIPIFLTSVSDGTRDAIKLVSCTRRSSLKDTLVHCARWKYGFARSVRTSRTLSQSRPSRSRNRRPPEGLRS